MLKVFGAIFARSNELVVSRTTLNGNYNNIVLKGFT